MFCFGSGVSVPSGCSSYCHEDEVPELEEAVAARAARAGSRLAAAVLLAPVVVDLRVGPARARARRPARSSPSRQRDDPLGAACRSPPRARSRPRPGRARAPGRPRGRSPRAGPSRASGARGRTPVAKSIAPSLKYWPNEKLPSISKKVEVVARRGRPRRCPAVAEDLLRRSSSAAPAAARAPRKYGFCGCMPALVSSVEWSSGARDQRRRRAARGGPSPRRRRGSPRAARRSSACGDCRCG